MMVSNWIIAVFATSIALTVVPIGPEIGLALDILPTGS